MLHIKTETGSHYKLNWPPKRWWRAPNPASSDVRTSTGEIWKLYPVTVGNPMVIVGPPIVPGMDGRIIQTAIVESIEWICGHRVAFAWDCGVEWSVAADFYCGGAK